ncbi:hypothetical protein DFH07DRAFT_769799 [Mycena maculata]|uniref:Uncharacterized protein n=1 Tax=Mycena maculata TaxID=230809 RepID=A0AAD7JN80_9AGAR|nr:hypothetical protein DFH07DRAFT_769799 [Mycena maculata]
MRLPRLLLLPTFSPPPRCAMAALAVLLAHLPNTVLEQFRDTSFTANSRMRNAQLFSGTSWVDLDDFLSWLRQRGDMDLLDLDSILPFDPRSMDGVDVSIQNTAFDGYPAVRFDDTRSATPSSGYSYPYDNYQSSNYSVPASEFDYLDASGPSTPSSGLDLFSENYESNLDWDPSLAAFFDSAELSFNLDTPFAPGMNAHTPFAPGMNAPVASSSDTSFFLRDPAPSHLQAADPAVFRGRKYYFACSNRSSSWTNHSGIQIPPDVDEDLCIRALRGESITDGALDSTDPTGESCSRIIGSGSGKKGKSQCPFLHTKDGKSYVAPICKLSCQAAITYLIPLDEQNIPFVVALPKPSCPHTHPPPPDTKVPTHVKSLYEKAVRTFGISIATVNKIEQAVSTIQIMGAAPGLVHPSLLQAATKQAIISALKRGEPGGNKSGWEADQAKEPRERYMHSFDFLPGRSPPSAVITTFDNFLLGCVEHVRSLNQDTTFKRMKAGLLMNEYELTAFFTVLNRLFTFGRIYMDAKGTDAFEFAWDKIDEAFYGVTGKHLSFKAWDPEGWLVTVSGDMEAAPWIGMARSFIKRMDSDKRPTVDEFLPKVVRICRRHALEGLKKSVKPHVDEDQWTRFQHILSLKTRDEVHDFTDGVFSLDITPITAWWNHKLHHKWLLPGLIECLSGLSHEDWMTTPFTSNGNETQHHWTNSQTGIGLAARECILRAKQVDQAVGLQFEASLANGVMANSRNELSHCTVRNAKRHTSAVEKAKRASAGNNKIKELRAELVILVAELKMSSSGVVRVTQKIKAKSIGIAPSLFRIATQFEFVPGQAAPRTNAPKRKAPAAGELDGIWMALPEVEARVPSYALQQDNDEGDSHNELMGPANTANGDTMVSPPDDADLGGPFVDPISPSAPSPAPPRSESPAPLSTRRSTRNRGASKTHDDAPAPKLKKMQATITSEASTSVKKCGKRKAKPWSVRHTDDKIYTSFEFLARFPEEYHDLYGDTPPA